MKIINLKTGVVAILFCLGFATESSAQGQRNNDRKQVPTFAQLLKQMDKNEDGKLAKTEVKGPLKENLDKVDTDEDGFISKKEFKKAPTPKRGSKR
ncbi:EF-hand domain-containing protein [Bizionia gelidisalsuginis]|uniref:EF-hand domain-containing protein n=1 Tax=Bizionia gelidisalsuginis TaxID=291188 RepID=A0ABY3M7Y9_9FLAO|nr:EF-hand domain-containing protein [Bizionia gelidisalsuginis]TYC09657.1 EF-hand domain-containing protein [Bizionia gelidisalsuginis]